MKKKEVVKEKEERESTKNNPTTTTTKNKTKNNLKKGHQNLFEGHNLLKLNNGDNASSLFQIDTFGK